MKGLLVFLSACVFAAIAGKSNDPSNYLKVKWLVWYYAINSNAQDKCFAEKSEAVAGAKQHFWKDTIFHKDPKLMTEKQFLNHLTKLYSSNKDKFEEDIHAFCIKRSELFDKNHDGIISTNEFFGEFECFSFTDDQLAPLCHALEQTLNTPLSNNDCNIQTERHTNAWTEYFTNPSRTGEEYHIADALLAIV